VIAKVRTSAVIQAPPEPVWTTVRDFNGLPGWHPAVVESMIENGKGGTEVGCVRCFRRQDGLILRERLVALDDIEMSMTYVLLDAPLPVRNYVAALRLLRVTEMNQTFVEWCAWYDCSPDDELRLCRSIHEVFQIGLDALRRRVR
jgi:hypothetical protein